MRTWARVGVWVDSPAERVSLSTSNKEQRPKEGEWDKMPLYSWTTHVHSYQLKASGMLVVSLTRRS